jgi:hypothetical protein
LTSNWTFDATGHGVSIHGTVTTIRGSCRVRWWVTNEMSGVVDDGTTSRVSPEGALIHLRAVAQTFGIEGANAVDLRAVDTEFDSAASLPE